jgi:hypothetical protein
MAPIKSPKPPQNKPDSDEFEQVVKIAGPGQAVIPEAGRCS